MKKNCALAKIFVSAYDKEEKSAERRYFMDQEKMIEEIMRHLDGETKNGVVRMSVLMDPIGEKEKEVSRKCCNVYGKTGDEIIGLLDMYTDLNAGKPDNERDI